MKRSVFAALTVIFLALSTVAALGFGRIPGLVSGIQTIQNITLLPSEDYKYWIAECAFGSWPLVKDSLGDDGIMVIAHTVTSEHAWGLLYKGGNVATLEAHSMGVRVAGYYTWSIRGPKQVRTNFLIAECPVRRHYTEVLALPAAARDWVKARSTCNGVATLLGVTYNQWPCIWESERGLVVTSLDYVSPGIYMGGPIDATALAP